MGEVRIHELIRFSEAQCHLRPVLRAEREFDEHYELIPCWQHPTLGRLEWSHVATLAEYLGLDESLSMKFLDRGCSYLSQSVKSNGWGPSLTVNMPFKMFASAEFTRTLKRTLLTRGVQPARLRLRFPGRSYVDGLTTALRNVVNCREHGIRFAVDGLEELSGLHRYIRSFEPEVASISSSLVCELILARETPRFWKLIDLANDLGIPLGADSVATQAAYLTLLQLGFAEFAGPAIGDLIAVPGLHVSSATA